VKSLCFVLLVSALVTLVACDQLSNYDKVSEEGIAVGESTLRPDDHFAFVPKSRLITGFFEADSKSNAMYEMRSGDVVRFTGWTVEFPTGLPGFEFEVVQAEPRSRDMPVDADPEPGDLLYLSEKEITNYLRATEKPTL